MALSRCSLATLSILASALLTAEALTVEAGTIVGVSVDASVFDTRSSAPYGCPPAGCLGENTRVSASWESKRARHLLFGCSPSMFYSRLQLWYVFSHPRARTLQSTAAVAPLQPLVAMSCLIGIGSSGARAAHTGVLLSVAPVC